MHFFKTVQIVTMFAVGIMALPTPGYTPTNQNTGDIVARSDTVKGKDVATSTDANKKSAPKTITGDAPIAKQSSRTMKVSINMAMNANPYEHRNCEVLRIGVPQMD